MRYRYEGGPSTDPAPPMISHCRSRLSRLSDDSMTVKGTPSRFASPMPVDSPAKCRALVTSCRTRSSLTPASSHVRGATGCLSPASTSITTRLLLQASGYGLRASGYGRDSLRGRRRCAGRGGGRRGRAHLLETLPGGPRARVEHRRLAKGLVGLFELAAREVHHAHVVGRVGRGTRLGERLLCEAELTGQPQREREIVRCRAQPG